MAVAIKVRSSWYGNFIDEFMDRFSCVDDSDDEDDDDETDDEETNMECSSSYYKEEKHKTAMLSKSYRVKRGSGKRRGLRRRPKKRKKSKRHHIQDKDKVDDDAKSTATLVTIPSCNSSASSTTISILQSTEQKSNFSPWIVAMRQSSQWRRMENRLGLEPKRAAKGMPMSMAMNNNNNYHDGTKSTAFISTDDASSLFEGLSTDGSLTDFDFDFDSRGVVRPNYKAWQQTASMLTKTNANTKSEVEDNATAFSTWSMSCLTTKSNATTKMANATRLSLMPRLRRWNGPNMFSRRNRSFRSQHNKYYAKNHSEAFC